MSDQERFMKYVKKEESGCWKWTGHKAVTGYCNFFYKGTVWLAHRASMVIFKKVENLTPGLQVCHSCCNRDCVNPEHLSEKTRKENNGEDKRAHGKDKPGELCHFSKLDWTKISEIRKKSDEGVRNTNLAKEYGVSSSCISSIVRNKTWKQVVE